MELKIDRDTCIGCGMCEGICPEVFEMDGESIAVIKGQPTEATQETAIEAMSGCPVGAILRID